MIEPASRTHREPPASVDERSMFVLEVCIAGMGLLGCLLLALVR